MMVLLFDTETNGLVDNRHLKLDKQPSVIEFYGCIADLESGRIDEEINFLIKPPHPIPPEITKITTIDDAMVADAPNFAQVADQIEAFIAKSKMVIAHNLSFDKDIVEIEFERLNRKVPWPEGLCTVEQTLHLKGFRLSLSALHEYLFEKPFAGAHRAKVDVEALLRCCVELQKRGELL